MDNIHDISLITLLILAMVGTITLFYYDIDDDED